MPSIRNLLCAALAVGVLLSSPRAEARFGKSSDSSGSSSSSSSGGKKGSSGGKSHSSSASAGWFLLDVLLTLITETRPPVVTYTAVAPPAPPPYAPPAYAPPPAEPPPPAQAPPPAAPPASAGQVRANPSQPSNLIVRLGVDGAAMNTTAGLGAFLGVEGLRAGLDARALALTMPTDDGSAGRDNITLTNVHLTYAVVATERARLRIEGGISSAHAPDLTALGPSLALSFEAGVLGNLDLELRAQATPYPYTQWDGQAGLALHLNSLVLRGGWRSLYLNDNGLVDDVVHEDRFAGPYAGLGFSF